LAGADLGAGHRAGRDPVTWNDAATTEAPKYRGFVARDDVERTLASSARAWV
jgi:hypothetical protein